MSKREQHGTKVYYVDGGCIGGNPGTAIYWSVARKDTPNAEPHFICRRQESARYKTNNEAEWSALIHCLEHVVEAQLHGKIVILSDSRLMVNQYTGMNKTHKKFQDFYDYSKVLSAEIKSRKDTRVVVRWVPRKEIKAVLGH